MEEEGDPELQGNPDTLDLEANKDLKEPKEIKVI